MQIGGKVIWNLYDPPACQNSLAYHPPPPQPYKGTHFGMTHHRQHQKCYTWHLNIVKHFTFEHNNSNQDTMSALTWHQYNNMYNFIASCVRITITIRRAINFFSSSPYNYWLKTFKFWNMLVMEWLFYKCTGSCVLQI